MFRIPNIYVLYLDLFGLVPRAVMKAGLAVAVCKVGLTPHLCRYVTVDVAVCCMHKCTTVVYEKYS